MGKPHRVIDAIGISCWLSNLLVEGSIPREGRYVPSVFFGVRLLGPRRDYFVSLLGNQQSTGDGFWEPVPPECTVVTSNDGGMYSDVQLVTSYAEGMYVNGQFVQYRFSLCSTGFLYWC